MYFNIIMYARLCANSLQRYEKTEKATTAYQYCEWKQQWSAISGWNSGASSEVTKFNVQKANSCIFFLSFCHFCGVYF